MKGVFKKFTYLLTVLLALIIAFTFCGCGSISDEGHAPDGSMGSLGMGGGRPSGGGSSSGGGDSYGDSLASSESSDGSSSDKGGSGSQQRPLVKQLTAAEWRDALNYDFWLNLFEEVTLENENGEQTTEYGIFSGFKTATRGLDTFDMHEIYVTDNGAPAVGAKVKLYDENALIYSAVTDSAGRAYVFGEGSRVEAVSGSASASAEISNGVTEITLSGSAACADELEIMFVVDTTGSMGDELSFLCKELWGIVTRVYSSLSCNIRLGLLFYRDHSDEYLTRYYDFASVNSTDVLNTVINNIQKQRSSGGGDYPEAVDEALLEAVNANWHTNSKTRLLFHVLDAPYHDQQENQSTFAKAVKAAAEKGIRIIPVAASGLDTLGQFIMRSAALMTGGTYAFLTDDSGIGAHHELPAVGEFTVEYLSDLIVRLIKGYYTGAFEEPVLWTQSESIV